MHEKWRKKFKSWIMGIKQKFFLTQGGRAPGRDAGRGAGRFGRVDVRQRRGCEPDLAQELGHRATHSERDDRPEHGILHRARHHLDPAADHRLDHGRKPDRRRGGSKLRRGADVEHDAARLFCARSTALTTTGNPSASAAASACEPVWVRRCAAVGMP